MSPSVWMIPVDNSVERPKTKVCGWAKDLPYRPFTFTYLHHPQTQIAAVCQTEKLSFQLFSFPVIRSVIIITLLITGMLNTPMVYHSDKTKAQLLGSWLKQWNLLEKDVRASLYRNMPSDIAMYYYSQELLQYLQPEHISEQWRLFTNSSK